MVIVIDNRFQVLLNHERLSRRFLDYFNVG